MFVVKFWDYIRVRVKLKPYNSEESEKDSGKSMSKQYNSFFVEK